VDVLEIDGASNTGIDNIRNLRDLVQYKAMQSRYKVVIIDEVHQISKPAFNALLKTLEEPPEKTIFIFATTELQKVPPTIISRCQYFEFKKVSQKDIIAHLAEIARKENLILTDAGLGIIARVSDGSIRDGLTLLDQAVAFCGKTIADADLDLILRTINCDLLFEFSSAVIAAAPDRIFPLVEKVIDSGYDLREFHKRLVEHFRDLLIVRTMEKPQDILHLGETDLAAFRAEAEKTGEEDLLRFLQALQDGELALRYSSHPQIAFETLLVKLCHFNKLVELKDVIAGFDEERSASGSAAGLRVQTGAAVTAQTRPSTMKPSVASAASTPSPAKPSPVEAAKAFTMRRPAVAGSPAVTPKPAAPAPAESSSAVPPALREAHREREAKREAALKTANVKLFQDKLRGRIISVEDPDRPRPKDEE
jgi:DNA polymerase-3 subunit gamma/tau